MPHETTTPTAGTVGSIERSGEQLTGEVYLDMVTDEVWEKVILAVVNVAGGDSERGERARRAVHALVGEPFLSRPVWSAATAVSWNFVAAVMSGDEDLRKRANALTKANLALAAEAQESLRRVAA